MNEQEIAPLAHFLSTLSKGTLGENEARVLLERFGSISGVALSPAALLMQVGHLSAPQAELLTELPGIVRRCRMEQCGSNPRLNRLDAAARYARALYTGVRQEQLFMLCLDSNFKLIEAHLLSNGSMIETSVPPRLMMESALHAQSGAVIFCHNHPAGRMGFSEADVSSTAAAINDLSRINVAMLDHLLVACGKVISLRRMHHIPENVWTNSGSLAVPYCQWVETADSDEA